MIDEEPEKGYASFDVSWSRHADAEERGSLWINCNDFFAWGCADSESIESAEDLLLLAQAMSDADLAGDASWGPLLYCARRAKLRPQGAAYPKNRGLWPLFDACGPEREVGIGNPYRPGEYRPGGANEASI